MRYDFEEKVFVGKIESAILVLVAAVFLCTPPLVQAQNWPERPITILEQIPPGVAIDIPARALARELSEALGQPVIIESRVGGGGIVLLNAVAKAEPNGYLLGFAAVGPAVIRPMMDKTVGFDFDRDFTPILMFGGIPNTLVASPTIGVTSVAEFVAYAKAHPDAAMAHGGPGTIGHLASILFAKNAGITLNFIPYRGSPPLIADLLGGVISAGFPPYNPAAKNAKILAVATEHRLEFLKDVPTMAESGYPSVVATTWSALVGPKNLPPEIVAKLNTLINAWINKPGQRSKYGDIGFALAGGAPSDVLKQVQVDREKWALILRENNITLDPNQ
jgi:tripartite-type tricarboxylate transporter receptor subunit TctC